MTGEEEREPSREPESDEDAGADSVDTDDAPIGASIKRPKIRDIMILPNLVTLLNALAGLMAISQLFKEAIHVKEALHTSSSTHLEYAAWLILAGMVCDALDGKLARMTDSSSFFGVELDSLCDAVTFGVAPALLMYVSVLHLRKFGGPHPFLERLSFPVAALYLFCVLVRLARFNVEKDLEAAEHGDFSGLPSPAGAGFISTALLVMLYLADRFYGVDIPTKEVVTKPAVKITLQIAPWAVALLALSMVSRIRYPHLLDTLFSQERSIFLFFLAAVAFAIVVFFPELSLFLVFFGYVMSGPVFTLVGGWKE